MASPEIHAHESPIRTPKQLIIVIVLAFVVPIIAALLLARLASSGMRIDPGATSAESVLQRIKPVAMVTLGEAEGPKGARSAAQVMQSTCNACHEAGAAGAPKTGDRAAWAKRIAEGQRQLVQAAIKGVRAMPPKGGNPDLTDLEVERAVVVMANSSGASFKEPPAPKPAAKADKAAK
jgi:cytochrome c5